MINTSMPPRDNAVRLALLGRRLPEGRLRIGFLCEDSRVQQWAFETVDLLRTAPQIDVCGAVVCKTERKRRQPENLSATIFEAYRSRCPSAKMLQPVDLSDSVPVWKLDGDAARERLASLQLDVLISFSAPLAPESCAGLARYGVWSPRWGDPFSRVRTPAFFWETYEDAQITSAALMAHTDVGTPLVLRRIDCATAPGFWYTKNAEETPTAMKRILIRCLYDLLIDGWERLTSRAKSSDKDNSIDQLEVSPTPPGLAVFLAKRAYIAARMRYRNARSAGNWFCAFRTDPGAFTSNRGRFTPGGFEELPRTAPDYGCADPFPVSTGGTDFIFAEEILPDERGRLVVYSKDGAGKWQNPPTVIMDTAHHLSYPCVFEHEGEYYLIPETWCAGRVELWRATRFPDKWALDTVYAEGVGLVDTTPVYANGRWYFFTAAVGPGADAYELLIYHSEQLRGPWEAHALNPVSSDIRAARMAGHFFRSHNRLIRPAQDCSGAYGRAMRLYEVLRLTPWEYEEREIEQIEACWHPRAELTHTLNATESIEVIDGWQRYPR